MKKLYGGLKMGWGRVVLFALLTGVYTGLVMLVPFLKDTSFQDIGISYEWWVIFAVLLVVNCQKGWEAALKCFVFFLISQPSVYLVQVLAGTLSVELAKMYYLKIWLPATFLTLPGGFIAWQCKRQNTLGALILGLGNTIQVFMGASYVVLTVKSFPLHLLSALVSFVSAALMTVFIQKEKRNRIIAYCIPVALFLVGLALLKLTGRTLI